MSIEPYESTEHLHRAVTDAIAELIRQAVAERGQCRISLSGGSTPRGVYERLAGRDLPWSNIHWFWGDERNVPPDDPESNYRMVCEAMLNHVPAPVANIFPVPVNIADPAAAAIEYEQSLKDVFGASPVWDLVLLGMGDDAHTASLFPATAALEQSERIFVENWVEKFDAYRYTLTAPAINTGREIWFLVAGEAKRDALAQVLGNERNPQQYPSQLIHPTRWFVTRDAHPG